MFTAVPSSDFLHIQRVQQSNLRAQWIYLILQDLAQKVPPGYSLQQGLLTHEGHLYLPPGTLLGKVLKLVHNAQFSGHFGHYKTWNLLSLERDMAWASFSISWIGRGMGLRTDQQGICMPPT
ncbi:UNVERIFIED_CONTAM: hypothetical protein K2H54_056814 [Gekko kuhli]